MKSQHGNGDIKTILENRGTVLSLISGFFCPIFSNLEKAPTEVVNYFFGNIGQRLLKLNENSTSLNFKQPRRVLCTNAVSQLTLLLQKAQSRKSTLLTISLVNNISWVA